MNQILIKNHYKLPVIVDKESIINFIDNIVENRKAIDKEIKNNSVRRLISNYLLIREKELEFNKISRELRENICKELSKFVKKGKNLHYRGYTIFKGYQGGIYFRKSKLG